MKAPEIASQIGGYLLTWRDLALCCKIGRLVVHSDGRVTGELQITNNSKATPLILLPSSQINFSAERTRSQFAKQLHEKFPDNKLPWVELFDYLGHKVQELARAGEPVIEVWAEDNIEPPEFLLKPFIIRGVPNIVFGEKGVNKSTFSYILGACMALPWGNNPLEIEVPDRSIKSLVLDWETNEKIFRYYLSRIKRGNDLDTFPLFYRKCRLPLAEELEAIEQQIKETGAEVLIIDSLAAASGGESGELKGSQSSLQFNSALRKLNITSWIIGQTSKDIESKRKTIYGSVLFTYYSRNIFELCSSEETEGNITHLALFHRDCNFYRRSPPMGLCLTYAENNKGITIQRESVNITEFVHKVTLSALVLNALKGGAKDTGELVECLDMKEKEASIRTTLNRLRQIKKVLKVGEKWGLPMT